MKTFGIDVSLYQKGLDFERAAAEGVKFVIIKASESTFVDPEFENNYRRAKNAGLEVGAYHYVTSTTKSGVIAEAKYVAKTLKGKQFGYPIFGDFEEASIKKLGKAKITELMTAFCTTLEAEGYWAGIYTNWDWYGHYCDGPTLAKRFSLWLAFWGLEMPDCPAQMWQFGGNQNFIRSNQIAGIICDQDYAYKDFPSLIKAKGLNGYSKTTPAPTPKPAPMTTIKVGDAVRMDKNAPVYGQNKTFLPWVYNETLYVLENLNGRVVFSIRPNGPITGAVDIKYLHKA